jgi:alkylated DNA repair dioxygenase AlkB
MGSKDLLFNFDVLNHFANDANDDNDENNFEQDEQSKFKFYGSLKNKMNIMFAIDYLDAGYARKLFNELKHIQYNSDEQSMVKIYGKSFKIPRKQIAYGDSNINYKFSGTSVGTYDWNKNDDSVNSKMGQKLKQLAKTISDIACFNCNYILVNNYLDQTNSIGYHSDDEKELGQYPVIAGISLGQEREIYFKSNVTNEVIKISLPHNSLYVMYYPTNKYWKHSIPKSEKILGQRISLTFRNIG